MSNIKLFLDEQSNYKEATLIAGFIAKSTELKKIDKEVIQAKKNRGLSETDPIKWRWDSMRNDVKDKMSQSEHEKLKLELLKVPRKLGLTLLACCVMKGDYNNTKESLGWAFKSVLQRLIIVLSETHKNLSSSRNALEVIFDWQSSNILFDTYREAYQEGYAFQDNTLQPLKNYNACPCLLCTKNDYSLAIQLSDFIMGATGEFFRCVFYKNKKSKRENAAKGVKITKDVKRHFSLILPQFRKGDKEVLGFGLICNTEHHDFVRRCLQQL